MTDDSMDSSSLPQLIPLLQTLLGSPSPLTLGATLTAFLEICPDRLDLLHQYYRHICRLIVDADEWGQVVALEVLTRYARLMLEKPELPVKSNGTRPDPAESEDEFEGVDPDLAMLLYCIKPLFQSRNPAVVLAVSMAYFHLAPLDHPSIGQTSLVSPLLRLAGAPRGGEEVTTLTWDVLAAMTEERPVSGTPRHPFTRADLQTLFSAHYQRFFAYASDPATVKIPKIRTLCVLLTRENATAMMREFKVGPRRRLHACRADW